MQVPGRGRQSGLGASGLADEYGDLGRMVLSGPRGPGTVLPAPEDRRGVDADHHARPPCPGDLVVPVADLGNRTGIVSRQDAHGDRVGLGDGAAHAVSSASNCCARALAR